MKKSEWLDSVSLKRWTTQKFSLRKRKKKLNLLLKLSTKITVVFWTNSSSKLLFVLLVYHCQKQNLKKSSQIYKPKHILINPYFSNIWKSFSLLQTTQTPLSNLSKYWEILKMLQKKCFHNLL